MPPVHHRTEFEFIGKETAMRRTARFLGLASIAVSVVLTGCALTRSEVRIASPVAPAAAATPTHGIAVIRSVKDERVFEQAPGEPSTPSLGFGGSEKATADVKARAIGRKRNSFGQAMGDVLLSEGQTVEGLVRGSLSSALRQAGYDVRDTADTAADPLLVDARIQEFWSWLQPGFWALTTNTNLRTALDLSRGETPVTVSVHAEESQQMATDSAWIAIVQKALEDYSRQVAEKAAAWH